MVSLSRLFRKTDEREKTATAATAPTEAACAPTAEAPAVPVELPQEFLDKFPGGMLRYRAEEAGTIDQVSSGLVRLFGCLDAEQFRALTARCAGWTTGAIWWKMAPAPAGSTRR